MFEANLKPHQKVVKPKKARRVIGLAFFLCTALSAQAQTNIVLGTAFGTNYGVLATSSQISSLIDSKGSLTINYAGTTRVTLTNQVDGTIKVANNFDQFTIDAGGGSISNGDEKSVLDVNGGTNLIINGGSFIGTAGSSTTTLPPFPGGGTSYSYSTNAARGGLIYNVQKARIINSHFGGATYALDESTIYGTEGLRVATTGLSLSNAVVTGGNGQKVYSANTDTYSVGGYGLHAENSSVVNITNGTVRGGQAGNAQADDGRTSYSIGGHGIYLKDSTLTIQSGTFQGGNSGTADISRAGHGVYAENATVNIHGGTLTGGTSSTSGSGLYAIDSTVFIDGANTTMQGGVDATAFTAINSDVTINEGTFTGGTGATAPFGFSSQANTGHTNNIMLNGGTFNRIGFSGGGTQYLTAGTNGLTVTGELEQNGGFLIVTNLDNAAFQRTILNAGSMQFANAFTLENDGYFTLASADSSVELLNGGNLTFASGSTNFIAVDSEGNSGLFQAGTINFQTNSSMSVISGITGLPAGTALTTTVAKASTALNVITASQTTNSATQANFEQNVNIIGIGSGRTGLQGILIENNNLKLEFATLTLREYWGVAGALGTLADELDSIANSDMLATIDEIADPDLSSKAIEQAYFTTFNNQEAALQGMRTAMGQSRSRNSEFRDQLKLTPLGAKGPAANSQLRGWIKYNGQYSTHNAEGINPEYYAVLNGGTVGIDTSIGSLLIGVSGGASHYLIAHDESDKAQSTTDAYQGNLYGTYGMKRGYLEASLAYGQNQVDTRTAEPFLIEGNFDATVASAYLGGGFDMFDIKDAVVFTPEASVQYSTYEQEAYTEESDVAVPRMIDDYDTDSLMSSLGMNIAMQNTQTLDTFGYRMDLRFHWMHEFNPDPDDMTFMLQGGTHSYPLSLPRMDEEVFRAGFGASFFNVMRQQPKNVMFRIDFDELFGDGFNAHNLSAKVVYAF